MAEIIDFFEKYKEQISYDEMNEMLEGAVQVIIGIGRDCPVQMFVTERNLVVGSIEKDDAKPAIACLRDIADAIELEMARSE